MDLMLFEFIMIGLVLSLGDLLFMFVIVLARMVVCLYALYCTRKNYR